MRIRSSDEGWAGPRAPEAVAATAPRGSYRAAVVGCGRMGSTIDDEHVGKPNYPWPWAHAPAVIEARNVELVAGVDVDPGRLANFGRRWGVDALYTDLREMVANERPDIVCVTTRSAERAEVVAALAEAGVRAIYATKPISRTLAEADAMIEACRAHGYHPRHRGPPELVRPVHQREGADRQRRNRRAAVDGVPQPVLALEHA